MVYGQPALSASIDIRTEVRVETIPDKKVEIKSTEVGEMEGEIRKTGEELKIQNKIGDTQELQFVTKTIELTLNHLDEEKGVKVQIDSELPLGSGLGSSSAVTTATAAAVSSAMGKKLDRENVSHLAYSAELEVQGAASRTGVNTSTYGGFLKVQEDRMEKLESLPELNVLVGYTGKYGNTGEMVESVKKLRESRPELINSVILAIGKATEAGIKALKGRKSEKVGALMNANQNLLEGLQVSSPELRDLINAARSSGATGAKLTGAGGGGCMIALVPEAIEEIAKEIRKEGGEPIRAKIGVEGMRY